MTVCLTRFTRFTRVTRARVAVAALCSIACGLPIAAHAQSASSQAAPAPSGAAAQGPLTIERVQSGALIAPDVKVTDVNGETATLVGAYGGWITDNTLLFGAGGSGWPTGPTG